MCALTKPDPPPSCNPTRLEGGAPRPEPEPRSVPELVELVMEQMGLFDE